MKVDTEGIISVTSNSAVISGNIIDIGDGAIQHGHCYSKNPAPTIIDPGTQLGTPLSNGNYVSLLSDLEAGTKYYVKAYLYNGKVPAYGEEKTFTTNVNGQLTVTDLEGNIYNTVTIGTQTWMKENLKTRKYNDNTNIPNVTDEAAWAVLTTPGYCWYNNDKSKFGDTYGALYNWYAVNKKKLCPTGWHVPSDVEWTIMENYLIANGYNYDGTTVGNKIAKALAGTANWVVSLNTGSVGNNDYPAKRNITGFTALPGGDRWQDGRFFGVDEHSGWWSSTEDSNSFAWCRIIYYSSSADNRYIDLKNCGYSVRCVKD